MKTNKLGHIKSTGFKTPDNYFETFENKLKAKVSSNKRLDINLESGFNVPDGYFDNIESQLSQKVKSDRPVLSLKSKSTYYYIAGIAAALVLLFAIVMNNDTPQAISPEMVEAYFEDSDLDTYELAELLSDADILDEDAIVIETNYNEENLEAYLLEYSDIEELLQ